MDNVEISVDEDIETLVREKRLNEWEAATLQAHRELTGLQSDVSAIREQLSKKNETDRRRTIIRIVGKRQTHRPDGGTGG